MNRVGVIFIAVAAVAACKSPSAPATTTPPASSKPAPALKIETSLQSAVRVRGEDSHISITDRMREYKIPAISIAVVENYEVVWAKAYGLADVEMKTPATEDTTFLAGSISKSVNALAQMMAVHEGLYVSLDTPINEALESWKLPDNEMTRAKPVTLRMLLSHTAGTTVHGFPGYAPSKPIPTIQQILDGKPPANTPPIRVDLAPGTKFRYSGGGTTITQLALTERAKKPYPDVLAERVLGPLNMTHSSYDQNLSLVRLTKAAAGYGLDGKVIDGKRFVYPEMAAAGLWTTASDLARFYSELARARAGKSKVITKEIATQMTTKVADVEPDRDGVGLGVFLMSRNGAAYFGHGGADMGFQADAVMSLEGGRGVVIMANSENGFKVFPEIERTIFSAYDWPGADVPVDRVPLDAAARDRFIGRYSLDGAPFEIVERGSKLYARIPFGPEAELIPTDADTLVNSGDAMKLQITANGLEARPPNRPPLLVPRPLTAHPLFLLEANKLNDAVAALKDVKDPKAEEARINQLGYDLIARDPAKAIEVLRLNATAFPDSANAHDSLAEAYARSGNKPTAVSEYERALKVLDADARIPTASKPAFKQRVDEELKKLR